MKAQIKSVSIIKSCPYCNSEVQILISKRQLKIMLKAMKCSTKSEAEMMSERLIGRDENGDLEW